MIIMGDGWRAVIGYGGTYEVSVLGVRRIAPGPHTHPGRILKQWLDSHGCPHVNLYLHGKATQFLVAHLIADAFLPPKSPTDQVLRHLNDDPTDNRIENLAWGTYSDNLNDAFRNGRSSPKGVAHCCAKLTEDIVREIRRLYATGEFSHRELAQRFGVSHQAISKIVRRKAWKHVA
jgi:hypothetical protein